MYLIKPVMSFLRIDLSLPSIQILLNWWVVLTSVRFRSNPHGESSGCIQELLALDIPVITWENFVTKVFRNEVYEVSGDVEPMELAEKILLIRNREIKQKLQSKKFSSYDLSPDAWEIKGLKKNECCYSDYVSSQESQTWRTNSKS